MNKPESNVEAQFNKDGIFFLNDGSIHSPTYEGNYLGILVEIAVLSESAIEPPNFSVSVLNKREVAILFTDWQFVERGDQKILRFSAYQRVPEGISLESKNTGFETYMSFLDLCFFAGNEAIPEVYGEDIETKPLEFSKYKDLGWILPTRFIDALIPALGKLDDSMLGGNMNQALLYGPITVIKS